MKNGTEHTRRPIIGALLRGPDRKSSKTLAVGSQVEGGKSGLSEKGTRRKAQLCGIVFFFWEVCQDGRLICSVLAPIFLCGQSLVSVYWTSVHSGSCGLGVLMNCIF